MQADDHGWTGLKAGERLAIFGFGGSAHLTLQVARSMGCEVFVFSRGEKHRELALELGPPWAGDAAARPDAEINTAIIFAPSGEVILPALECVRPGGTVVAAGIHLTDIPGLNYEKHLFYEKVLTSVEANTRQDGHGLFAAARASLLTPKVSAYGFEELISALISLKKGKLSGSAVILLGS